MNDPDKKIHFRQFCYNSGQFDWHCVPTGAMSRYHGLEDRLKKEFLMQLSETLLHTGDERIEALGNSLRPYKIRVFAAFSALLRGDFKVLKRPASLKN